MTQNLCHLAETLLAPQRHSALILDPRAVGRTLQIAGLVASRSAQHLLCSDLAGGCDSTCRRRGNGALRIAACARACAHKRDSNGGPFRRAGCDTADQRTKRADTAHGEHAITQHSSRYRQPPHTRRRHGAGQCVPHALSSGVGGDRVGATRCLAVVFNVAVNAVRKRSSRLSQCCANAMTHAQVCGFPRADRPCCDGSSDE